MTAPPADETAELRRTPVPLAGTARTAIRAGLLVAMLLPIGGAQARPSFSSASAISVDVTPLLDKGLSGYALVVRDDVGRAFNSEFAGRLRQGQRLVVVVRGVSLASYVGGRDLLWPQSDFMDGDVSLLDADGRPLATQKLLVQSPASSGGAWYIRGGELRRTAVLSQVFASWARRYVSG
jgi:hypothetical protein